MDPACFAWRPAGAVEAGRSSCVSSLDLLEAEVQREAVETEPQWACDQKLHVEGAPAATLSREISRRSPRKPSTLSRPALGARRPSTSRIGNGRGSSNNAEEELSASRQLQLENERLQREVVQWRREMQHVREEKRELEESFRRLDQEIGDGYNLSERKEKELRVAELMAKNQKISQRLEKELQSNGELRHAHIELQGSQRKLQEQVTLLNQVLATTETKHAALSSTHATLTASYEAAQATIEMLQSEVHELQNKLVSSGSHTQQFADYEAKLQTWERRFRESERKLGRKKQKSQEAQQAARAAEQEVERMLQRNEELEAEVRSVHDQMIRTNAAMRTLEARLEANLQTTQFTGTTEALNRRVRHLEGELLEKNRAHAELTQTFNQFLSAGRPDNRLSNGRSSLSARNGQSMASRVAKLTTRIASLTDKLRDAQDARDHKSRCLDVLMQAFPFLLHRLDVLQDRFAAAVESNDILKSALQQMQEPSGAATSSWTTGIDEEAQRPAQESGETLDQMTAAMYLHLARDTYLLSAPYPMELLAETTGAQAFSDHRLDTTTQSGLRTLKKKFAPFRAVTSAAKPRDRLVEMENGDGHPTEELVLLAADTNDTSGASYLNRSKINAFLEVAQSRSARRKFKSLVVGKLAECLTKLRELSHRSSVEAATRLASVQMLQREVDELKQKLKQKLESSQPHQSEDFQDGQENTASSSRASSSLNKRRFLLKLVDVYADKQQQEQSQHRQSTFLTQPLSSDVLITSNDAQKHTDNGAGMSADNLCLSDCELDDDDVRQLMLKLLVTGARFRELRLDANRVTDVGAQHVADFLEKCPPNLRVLNLTGNTRLTCDGIELMRQALERNQRIQRVEVVKLEAGKQMAIIGLAAQQAFEESGDATEILRVVLSSLAQQQQQEQARVDLEALHPATPEAVDAMTEKLRQLGFTYKVRRPATGSRPRSAPTFGSKRRVPSSSSRSGTASSTRPAVPSRNTVLPGNSRTSTNTRRRQIKKQQELRFQTLEAAIRRASAPRSRQHVSSSRTQMPSTQLPASRVGSSRSRTLGQAHIDMVRGLKR